jgi:ent-kaurene synthase
MEMILAGLQFIGRNFSVIMDEETAAPVGFNLTFSYMLSLAIGMGLEFLIGQTDINVIFHLREMEIKRFVNKSSSMEVMLIF